MCWTDIKAGDGALAHHDEQAPATPAEAALGGAAKLLRRFDPPLSHDAHGGLATHLSQSDPRARRQMIVSADPEHGACVIRGPSGATALVQRTGLVVDGADIFANDILQLTDNWLHQGSPRFTDWRCQLTLQERPAGRFWRPLHWTTTNTHQPDPATPTHE